MSDPVHALRCGPVHRAGGGLGAWNHASTLRWEPRIHPWARSAGAERVERATWVGR